MEIEYLCRNCGKRNESEADSRDTALSCSHCSHSYPPVSDFTNSDSALSHCGICGCRDLFIQKDFNRKLGVAIAVVGAVLAPFTKLISLLVCAVIDLLLYRALPFISVCYRCHAIYRGFARNEVHEGFNLGINDRYRAAER